MANQTSQLDQTQIMQRVHDEANKLLQVSNLAQFITTPFDTVIKNNVSPTQEVFTYKVGGLIGNTVATLTVTYTDSSKTDISSVVRT